MDSCVTGAWGEVILNLESRLKGKDSQRVVLVDDNKNNLMLQPHRSVNLTHHDHHPRPLSETLHFSLLFGFTVSPLVDVSSLIMNSWSFYLRFR